MYADVKLKKLISAASKLINKVVIIIMKLIINPEIVNCILFIKPTVLLNCAVIYLYNSNFHLT